MTKLVFIVLCCLYKIACTWCSSISLNIYLDFSTYSSCLLVSNHILIQFLDCIVVWSSTNIKEEAKFRLQEFTNTLKEPFVRINFSVISLFYAEHKVDSASFEHILGESKVPSCDLEAVQGVRRNFRRIYALYHDVTHVFHFPIAISICGHEPFLKENLFIQKFLLPSKLFETFWDPLIPITNCNYQKVIFVELVLFIKF